MLAIAFNIWVFKVVNVIIMDLQKLKRSFGYAISGVLHAFKTEQNLLIHFFIAFLVIILSFILRISAFEMAILGITMLVVIVTEMINTAIENVIDLITAEHKVEAKNAKDVAAGMVLVTASGAIIIGILIFTPHILRLFR